VDDDVFDWLYPYNWCASRHKTTTVVRFYAVRHLLIEQVQLKIYLHRIIAGAPNDYKVYFKNKNESDCRRENLLIRSKYGKYLEWDMSSKTSKFQGVKWDMFYGIWQAAFAGFHIGYYAYELDAAKAYNIAVKKAQKEKITLNKLDFIDG
jgi:hypothetical protein